MSDRLLNPDEIKGILGLKPLAEVDLRTPEERGQLRLFDYTKQELFKSITEKEIEG